ncbi:MAG: lipoprotein-releasing ABC transporter permease subunit [Rickettsiales bacterium]|jgi:lipoprotein-releasing system permease protein|nr:lipoprotein-releasing ABC transporter permease subunit [Rickettsiales bacterium]
MLVISKVEFFIARRYLKAKRKEKFISVTATFSFVGIALGVATLIIVLSIMNGFRDDLIKKIIGVNAPISIFPKNESQQNYVEIIKNLKDGKNISSVNPLVESQAMFLNERHTSGGMVKAILFDDFKNKKDLFNSIENIGEVQNFDESNYVFIGKSLAESLDLSTGGELKIVSPDINNTIVGIIPKIKTYEVAGIFKSGLQEYDAMTVFIPLKLGQLQFGYKNSVSSIEVFLDNVIDSSKEHIKIQDKLNDLGYDFFSVDWKEANTSLIEALNIERNVMFIILSLIVIIAAFNIISSLTMLVMDKNKQIALLKTIGMSDQSIMNIFFICGTIIGFFGAICGMIVGVIFSLNTNNIKIFLERILGINLFNPEIYSLTELPSRILVTDVMLVVSLSMVLSFLSTLYPAKKAAKINPAEILRYE